jgi:hypothetical protein
MYGVGVSVEDDLASGLLMGNSDKPIDAGYELAGRP